jgi:hypothetical protein
MALEIIVEKAVGQKCARCWRITEDVGSFYRFNDICFRCLTVLVEEYNAGNLTTFMEANNFTQEQMERVFYPDVEIDCPELCIHPTIWLEIMQTLNYLLGEIRDAWYQIAEQIATETTNRYKYEQHYANVRQREEEKLNSLHNSKDSTFLCPK